MLNQTLGFLPELTTLAEAGPPSPAPGAYPLTGTADQSVLPYTSITTHSPDVSGSSRVITPEAREAIDLVKKGVAAQMESQAAQNEQDILKAMREDELAPQLLQSRSDALRGQDELRAAYEKERTKLLAEAEERRAKLRETENVKGYWEDMSTPRRVLSALFLGMGAAAEAQGGVNAAWRVYENAEAADTARKMARAKAAADDYARTTGKVEEAAKRYRESSQYITDQAILKNEQLKALVEFAIKKTPAIEAKGKMLLGDLQAKSGQLISDQVKDYAPTKAWSKQGDTVTTVQGEKSEGGPKATLSDLTEAAATERSRDQSFDMYSTVKENPEKAENVKKAFLEHARATSAKQGDLKSLYTTLEATGVLPSSLSQRVKDPIERKILSGLIRQMAFGARQIDDRGAISDKTIDLAALMANLDSAGPAELANLFLAEGQFQQRKLDLWSLSGRLPKEYSSTRPATSAAPRAMPGTKPSASENDFLVVSRAIQEKRISPGKEDLRNLNEAYRAYLEAKKQGKIDSDARDYFREYRKRSGL